MIIVRKMTKDDIDLLNLQDCWIKKHFNRQQFEDYLSKDVPAWIVSDSNGPLCAFGGSAPLGPGVLEVWFNLIEKRKIKTQIRIVTDFIKRFSKSLKIRRMFAPARRDWIPGRKFLSLLRFKNESPDGMECYFPDGSDAIMYALTFKENL